MFFSQRKAALIRWLCVPWCTCLCRKLGNSLTRNFSSSVCCLRLLIVILVYSPTLGHIIQTVGEERQWKLWQRMLYLSLSKWTALCMAVGLFSAPCLKEWMAAVSSQMQATAGPLQTISTTMLSSSRVLASVSKPSLFLMKQLQERSAVTNTLLWCILMCANQFNSGSDIHLRYCSFPQQMPVCFFYSCSSQRFLKERIATTRGHFQRNRKKLNLWDGCVLSS